MNSTFTHIERIEGGLSIETRVKIEGNITPYAQRFAVNLQCGPNMHPRDDVALHFSPHFESYKVVRNTITYNQWGQEEIVGLFPFQRGSYFTLEIICETDGYQIFVDGKYYVKFLHRVPFQRVSHIAMDGDITLQGITYGTSQPLYGFNAASYPAPSPYPSAPSYHQQPHINPYSSTAQTLPYPSQNLPSFSQQPGNYPQSPSPNYYSSHPEKNIQKPHNTGLLEKAGMALAGTALAGGGLAGSILHGKKAMKSHKKAHKKALKYGIPIAGVGLGAYALKKGFRHGSSSSSSSSD